MDELTEELQSLIRMGIVSNINETELTATVKYIQQDIMSGELKLLQNNPSGKWIPELGEYVLCLLIPGGDGDGFILGGI